MSDASPPAPSFGDLLKAFGQIGLINFGGPAGQIALMHRALVDEKKWLDEEAFLHALNFCTLLPGPEAQQLATYIGWRMHGLRGGLAAGALFIIPGAVVILALSILYAYAADVRLVAAAFLGVKAAVLAIVVEALLRIGRRALNAPVKRWIAGLSFLALAVLSAPFPLIVLLAAVVGFAMAVSRPHWLKLKPALAAPPETQPRPLIAQTLATIIGWLVVWAAPVLLAAVLLGQDHVLVHIGQFFAKLATVTFGGAYAVLAYMAQEAVSTHGWLKPAEMVDGLGLAETTPGPLILVTEFVGFLAAFRAPAPFTPLIAGLLGAGMTLWVTFVPSYLYIFAAAPWLDRLERARPLQGALTALSAAVVGVIANLTLWFSLHVMFARFRTIGIGAVSVSAPDFSSLNLVAVGLSVLAALLLFRGRAGVMQTLAVTTASALGLHVLGWG